MSAIARQETGGHHPGVTSRHPDGKNSPEAQRARFLVEVMEAESSADFARWLGIDPRRWHNFEAGYPISRDVATRLMRKIPGLSFDWIFDGSPRGLSIEMARKLGEGPLVPEAPAPAQKPATNKKTRRRLSRTA